MIVSIFFSQPQHIHRTTALFSCYSLLPFLSSASVVVVNKWPCGTINLSWTCTVCLFYYPQIVKRGAESERWGRKSTARWLKVDCNTDNLEWADWATTVTLLATCWMISWELWGYLFTLLVYIAECKKQGNCPLIQSQFLTRSEFLLQLPIAFVFVLLPVETRTGMQQWNSMQKQK